MTLHLIIFASKGHCSEIKHSLMQSHPLCLKCPLEFASEKAIECLSFRLQNTGEGGNIAVHPQASQGGKRPQTLKTGSSVH